MKRPSAYFWLLAPFVGADVTPQWTTPENTILPDQIGYRLWGEMNGALNLRQLIGGAKAVSSYLALTTREIGYCAGAHLDVFDFGSGGTTKAGLLMNAYSYFVLPEVRSLRVTGAWYSTSPVNVGDDGGDGYCPLIQASFTSEDRYSSAEGVLHSSYATPMGAGQSFLSNSIVDWYTTITKNRTESPPVLRTTGVDDLPVQRLLLTAVGGVPQLKDVSSSAVLTECENSNCLTNSRIQYRQDLSSGCSNRIPIRNDVRYYENKLNEYLCPRLEEYKAELLKGANYKGKIGLSGLSDSKIQSIIESVRTAERILEGNSTSRSSFLSQMSNVVSKLKEANYTITGLGEGSDYCATPEAPTWEEVREVLEYIRPDIFVMIFSGLEPHPDDELIENMNTYLSLLDGLVPVQRRMIYKDETALLSVCKFLTTIECEKDQPLSTSPAPTLAPDGPGICSVGDWRLEPHDDNVSPEDSSDQWRDACHQHRWSLKYKAVMAGSLTGSVMTTLLWHCCRCLDTEEEQRSTRIQGGVSASEAVLFAH